MSKELLSEEELKELYDPRSVCTPEERLEAVANHILKGMTIKDAANQVPNPDLTPSVMYQWKRKKWYPKLVQKLRGIQDEELTSKAIPIMKTALDQINDRVLYGDEKVTKDGERIRQKVSARDLTHVVATLQDMRPKWEEADNQRNKEEGEIKDTLQDIAGMLMKTVKEARGGVTIHDHTDEKDITDVISEDEVPDNDADVQGHGAIYTTP